MASVSARFKGAGCAAAIAADCELWAGIVSEVCGTAISLGLVVTCSEGCAMLFVAATPDDDNALISTGLDDRSSCVFSSRNPAAVCCGLPCAAVDGWFAPPEAMAASVSLSHVDVSSDIDCAMP
jgi:hypothetical protein